MVALVIIVMVMMVVLVIIMVVMMGVLVIIVRVDQFHVNQTRNSMFQSYCTYDLLSPDGLLVYQGVEERVCCGPRMDVKVRNTQGHNVLNLILPYECCSWDTILQISGSSGEPFGYIQKNWASFNILNPSHQVCLTVKCPGWGEGFMSDVTYQVKSADKSVSVGVITRVWRGFCKQLCNGSDNYIVRFPNDLDVTMKAMLLACTIFIDLLYHKEQSQARAASVAGAASVASAAGVFI
ncbi:phospholipid scramblase 3-like [Mixophyes fleayi]|uniref:phospholipid scramblase 3-like n=1 Tax=Mixophyes fleayi TaxID=3061075 RepID=UPI003F4DD829